MDCRDCLVRAKEWSLGGSGSDDIGATPVSMSREEEGDGYDVRLMPCA